MKLSHFSHQLFIGLAEDAGNWSGTPLVEVTPAERGNLTDLKRKGLIQTWDQDERGDVFADFTPAGAQYAKEHGIDLSMWVDLPETAQTVTDSFAVKHVVTCYKFNGTQEIFGPFSDAEKAYEFTHHAGQIVPGFSHADVRPLTDPAASR